MLGPRAHTTSINCTLLPLVGRSVSWLVLNFKPYNINLECYPMYYKCLHTWLWASLFRWILNSTLVRILICLLQTQNLCAGDDDGNKHVAVWLGGWKYKKNIAHGAGIGRRQTVTEHTRDLKPTHTLSWESHLCLKSRDIGAGEIPMGTELTHLNEWL